MEVQELGHAVLYVHDLERSVHFYRDILGFTQISPEGMPFPAAAFNSKSGRTHHELLLIEVGPDAQPVPRSRHAGLYHLGLRVGDNDDDLREALKSCKENGVTIVGMSDHHVSHSLYIEDPDGNELELYVDVPGVDWRSDPSLVMAPVRPLAL